MELRPVFAKPCDKTQGAVSLFWLELLAALACLANLSIPTLLAEVACHQSDGVQERSGGRVPKTPFSRVVVLDHFFRGLPFPFSHKVVDHLLANVAHL